MVIIVNGLPARSIAATTQSAARTIDRKVRIAPETPLRETGVSAERIRALVITAC